jgi:hypothetical protein
MQKDMKFVDPARIKYSHWAAGLAMAIAGLGVLMIVPYDPGLKTDAEYELLNLKYT